MMFERYFAEKSLEHLPEFQPVREQYSSELQWIDDYQSFRMQNMHTEKKCVIFARKRGPWLKPFHCYDHRDYRFYSLDVAEGCRFDCVYCYLQSYLNHGALVLFFGLEQLERELQELSKERFWISTGLLSDSLLAEKLHPLLPQVSTRIPERSVLELRSKWHELDRLENPAINRESVILSWSLNPQSIAHKYEYGAANLTQRIQAAEGAVELGYRVAFHLDPVFYYDGWEKEYGDLFQKLHKFKSERIAFFSVGLFRYMPELGSIIRKRFPFHPILTGEFFMDSDGKYHYLRYMRKEVYRAFDRWLTHWEGVPVFRSMETF